MWGTNAPNNLDTLFFLVVDSHFFEFRPFSTAHNPAAELTDIVI